MNYTQPYINGINPYQQYQQYQPNMYQPNMYQAPIQNVQRVQDFNKFGLQGKFVDSIEVAKAMDIPFDSISFFPLTDNSAIITKQIQMDGTAKMIVYKPILENDVQEPQMPDYITKDDFNKGMKKLENFDGVELLNGFKELKKEIEALKDSLKPKKEK